MKRSHVYLVLILFIVGYFVMEQKFQKKITSAEKKHYEEEAQYFFANLKIYRDDWGVPHIYGETDESCAFGVGFVTCEYNFELLQQILLASRGVLAQAVSYKYSTNDYYVHLIKTWEIIDEHYDTKVSESAKKICRAYAKSINYYASINDDQLIDRMLFPVNEKDIFGMLYHKLPTFVKFERVLKMLMSDAPPPFFLSNRFEEPITSYDEYQIHLHNLYSTSPFYHQTKENNEQPQNNELKGSNGFVVSPIRSADRNSTYLNINPHIPWEGPNTLFELHIHSNEITYNDKNEPMQWSTAGFTYIGMPIIAMGHNQHLGWTHVINRPDILDIYLLETHPENPNLYKYDGEWREFEISEITTKVRLFGPVVWDVKKERVWCEYGPVIRASHGTYAVAFSGFDPSFLQFVDQYLQMNKAHTFDQWRSALSLSSLPLLNYLYADETGNIYYHYNAKIPIRSPNYIWDEMLPGNTSETKWGEYVPFDQLPHMLNPPSGFLQNCNTSPFNITLPHSINLKPDDYPLSFGIERSMNNRGIRALELLGNSEEISWDYFKEVKFDVTYANSSKFIEIKNNLIKRCEKAWNAREEWMGNSLMLEALEILKTWDHSADEYNSEASLCILTIYPFLRIDLWDLQRDYELNIDRVAERLQLVTIQLRTRYRKLKVQWHLINRLIHGSEVNLSLSGGPDLLFSIYGRPYKGEDHLEAVAGDATIMMVKWEKGVVKSEAVHPFGSTPNQPKSAHYSDQSVIFADKTLRRVIFNENDLIGKRVIDFSERLKTEEDQPTVNEPINREVKEEL